MKKLFTIAIAIALFPAISLAATAELIRVIEGDTIVAKVRNIETTLILAGIDCPALEDMGGKEAKAFTEQALSEMTFRYSINGRDKNFRNLALVTTSTGKNLNLALIRAGHARADQQSATNIIRTEEKKAQTAKLGIWAGAPPQPPAEIPVFRVVPPPQPQTQPPIEIPVVAVIPPQKQKPVSVPEPVKQVKTVETNDPTEASEGINLQPEAYIKIIDGCIGTWAIDERLVYSCIDQQVSSKEVVTNLEPSEIKSRCQKKWGDDYRKIQTCVEQKTTSKREIKHLSAGSKEIRECQQKWGNDTRLVSYCLENR